MNQKTYGRGKSEKINREQKKKKAKKSGDMIFYNYVHRPGVKEIRIEVRFIISKNKPGAVLFAFRLGLK